MNKLHNQLLDFLCAMESSPKCANHSRCPGENLRLYLITPGSSRAVYLSAILYTLVEPAVIGRLFSLEARSLEHQVKVVFDRSLVWNLGLCYRAEY